MKTRFAVCCKFRHWATALALAGWGLSGLVATVCGQAPPSQPVLQFATGLPGKQVRMVWPSQPGQRYRIEKSTNLSSGSWQRVATVDSSSTSTQWLDPEAVVTRCFYRVTEPAPEVFSLEPPLLAIDGGTVFVRGQNLPAGARLVLEIEGAGTVTAPLEPAGDGLWRAVVSGSFPPGASVHSARVTHGGTTVAGIDQQISITGTGRAEDGPAGSPPSLLRGIEKKDIRRGMLLGMTLPPTLEASNPVPGIGIVVKGVKRPKSNSREIDDGGQSGGEPLGMAINEKGLPGDAKPPKKKEPKSSHRTIPPSSGLPGEVSFHFDALSFPKAAGPQLAWIMTYRSGRSMSSGHGPQWDFSYNIFIEPVLAADGVSISAVRVHDGGGRADLFRLHSSGNYRCDGLHREGTFAGNTFTLTFADQSKWVFKPLDGSPAAGRIASIMDRNGVALACDYDAATGLLSSVSSLFGQTITVAWDASGGVPRISSISDHTGRIVPFSAYGSGETGGADGALKSIGCPRVPGIAPEAGDYVFTYTQGASDPNLNHNLLSITDGAGRELEAFTYSSVGDPRHPEYDRCASHRRHQKTGHVTILKREARPGGGYTTFEVDETGRLRETDCDALHRVTAVRDFTGFCTPGTAADSSNNRPAAKLRADDPDFFETRYTWNRDHSLTTVTDPDGTKIVLVYQREFDPAAPPLASGNLRSVTSRAAGGGERVVSIEHLPGFGTPESMKPGGPIRGSMVKCGRNPGGDVYAQGRMIGGLAFDGPDEDCDDKEEFRPGGPIRGAMVKAGRNPGGDVFVKGLVAAFPDYLDDDDDGDSVWLAARSGGFNKGWNGTIKGNSRRRGWNGSVKGTTTRAADPGYVGPCDAGPSLMLKEEGGRHTPFYKRYRPSASSARGITINTSHIEYETAAIIGNEECDDGNTEPHDSLFRKILDRGEAGDNAAFVSRVVTGHGQVMQWSYDSHGNRVSYQSPVVGRTVTYSYDSLGRCESVQVGTGPDRRVCVFAYHADSGLPASLVIDPAGLAVRSEFHYGNRGRCVREIDPLGHDRLYEWSPAGRLTRSESPPVAGARIATTYRYDAGGRIVTCDVAHLLASGSVHPDNPAYTTFVVRDEIGRITRIASEERPVDVTTETDPVPLGLENFAVIDFTYTPAGEIARVSVPAVCRGATQDRACDFQYDERGFLHRRIHGGQGLPSVLSERFDYQPSGLLRRVTGEAPGLAEPVVEFGYDGYRRLTSFTDPMGNVTAFSYDSRGGVTREVYGQTEDVPGSAGNTLLARSTAKLSGGRSQTAVMALACSGGPDPDGLTLPSISAACYDLELGNNATSSSRALFHGWFQKDDEITEERFTAGSTAPPVLHATTVTRSPSGLPQQVSLNGDLLATFSHDAASRLVQVGNVAETHAFTLDDKGRVRVCSTTHLRTSGPPHQVTSQTFVHDALDRCITSSDGKGNTCSFGYDSLGRCVEATTPRGLVIRCDYDGASSAGPYSSRQACDLDGDGAPDVVVSSLVRCGELLVSRDALGYQTTCSYDSLGRLVRCDDPEGTSATWSYDARGFHRQSRLADGTICDFELDLNGRVVGESVHSAPAGAVDVEEADYAYDGLNRLVRAARGTGVITRSYDSLDNLLGESDGTRSTQLAHNHRGRTSLRVVSGGTTTLHQLENRDGLGRLLSISLSGATGPAAVSFGHLGMRVCKTTHASGVVTDYDFRGDGEGAYPGTVDFGSGLAARRCTVKAPGGAVLSETVISYDRDQNVAGETTTYGGAGPVVVRQKSTAYDLLGRTTACVITRDEHSGLPPVAELDVSYVLDARGDRVSTIGGAYPGSYSQSTGDAPRALYSSWPGGNLQWDASRNLTQIPYGDVTHVMEYDELGRLMRVRNSADASLVAEFSYDVLDRLLTVKTHDDGVLSRFVYDDTTCIQELGADDLPDLVYVTSRRLIHQVITRAGSTLTLHGSRCVTGDNTPIIRGSALGGLNKDPGAIYRTVCDSSGAVIEHRDCDDACEPVFLSADGTPSSAGGSPIPIRWTAPEVLRLSQTRLLHFPGGTYSPALGKVTSKDKPYLHKKEYVGHVSLMK